MKFDTCQFRRIRTLIFEIFISYLFFIEVRNVLSILYHVRKSLIISSINSNKMFRLISINEPLFAFYDRAASNARRSRTRFQ